MYCVVANMPVIDGKGKTFVVLKFWNCIMCSNYFLRKPEIVFRVQQPHLFIRQPQWLYQAAVCQRCCRSLQQVASGCQIAHPNADQNASCLTSKPVNSVFHANTCTGSALENLFEQTGNRKIAIATCVAPSEVKQPKYILPKPNYVESTVQPTLPSTAPSSGAVKLGKQNAAESLQVPSVASLTSSVRTAVNGNAALAKLSNINNSAANASCTEDDDDDNDDEPFQCPLCSSGLEKVLKQARISQIKFPSLFSLHSQLNDHIKVCVTCFERLNRQRDRFEAAKIPEESRNYFAHIKVWTGQDVKELVGAKKENHEMQCFVCERDLSNLNEQTRPLLRWKYPSLFKRLKANMFSVLSCYTCYKRISRLRMKFDKASLEEDGRKYAEIINSWREQKGLTKLNL